jgi:hypothetical protein
MWYPIISIIKECKEKMVSLNSKAKYNKAGEKENDLKRSKVDKFIARYGIPIGMLLIASFHILKNWIEVSDSIAVPYLMLTCLFMIYSGFRQGGCLRRDKNSGDTEE